MKLDGINVSILPFSSRWPRVNILYFHCVLVDRGSKHKKKVLWQKDRKKGSTFHVKMEMNLKGFRWTDCNPLSEFVFCGAFEFCEFVSFSVCLVIIYV